MPPLSDAELKELEQDEKKKGGIQSKDLDSDRDPEVYDFEALRNELDDEDEENDDLAKKYEELEGDDDELNDVTFGDEAIGKLYYMKTMCPGI